MDLANLLSHTVYTPKDSSHYKRSAPLSPPVEEPKCSLPSISALLEGADGAQHSAKRQRLSPHRDDIRHYEMPPTPPLRPGSGNGQSRASPVNTKESHHRSSVSSTSSIHINAQPYASPAPSVSSYTSPVEAPQHQHHQQPMYYTRPPTASTFAPATPVTVPAPMPTVQTQHHHAHGHSNSQSSSALISPPGNTTITSPSTAAPFQQNHDRYICRTCHKAFSRPSSLRIHSHSHTGEKPFRCTHAGCGKAFSVRSNMKRHERGCHSGRPVPAAATALVV
ncbi:uncharacterized protein N7446_003599 [Penicillium canescens]|uniref:uncharacterized protein n=1 Tax=Penicillium canescens TaxID=5083 RepID=UPI0026E0FE33|nr:uncharacterized protein N7446_003599 [Penicillium canescens]KAJ6066562.1 hypothetical protein N7446_003599 [Penicillium canescens]